jgi:phospholipid/cholesterol/gamma-HCH transport system substrate-binding protein
MARESARSVALRRLLGLGYIAALVGLIALSVAFYNKAFNGEVLVTVKFDHTGNQLAIQSDVKERGIIVGSVKSVHSNGDGGATIKIAIDPSHTDIIPANVTAQILPKTLFGEQFVSLNPPADFTATTCKGTPQGCISSKDVINQDTTPGALESEKVLGDLLPILTAVSPTELNSTLTALATALQGRGEELGKVFVNMDNYLKQFNPQVPQLLGDLNQLAQVATEYNDAAPAILDTFNNLLTGARTVIAKQDAINTVLTTANSTSNIFNSFLADNESRLITIVETTDKVYNLLDEYSPSFTCMLSALTKLDKLESDSIVNNQIQLSAQVVAPVPGFSQYKPGEEPRIITGYGPNCFGLPNPQVPFKVPGAYRCINDGAALTSDPCARAKASAFDQQAIGSPAENALVNTLIAKSYGTTPDKVPSIATVLAAPALRGEVVNAK